MTDRAGRSELHYAAHDGQAVRVGELLDEGADPSVADDRGFRPLHFAAQSYEPEIIRQLIAHGAEVDAVNGMGNTALWMATFSSAGRGEAIAALLAGGADPDRENKAGVSPRALSERIANYDIKQFFL